MSPQPGWRAEYTVNKMTSQVHQIITGGRGGVRNADGRDLVQPYPKATIQRVHPAINSCRANIGHVRVARWRYALCMLYASGKCIIDRYILL